MSQCPVKKLLRTPMAAWSPSEGALIHNVSLDTDNQLSRVFSEHIFQRILAVFLSHNIELVTVRPTDIIKMSMVTVVT